MEINTRTETNIEDIQSTSSGAPEWRSRTWYGAVTKKKTETLWRALWNGEMDGLSNRQAAWKFQANKTAISHLRKAAKHLPHRIGDGAPCAWADVPRKKSQEPDLDRFGPLCEWIREQQRAQPQENQEQRDSQEVIGVYRHQESGLWVLAWKTADGTRMETPYATQKEAFMACWEFQAFHVEKELA